MARLLELSDARSAVRLVPKLGGAVADMYARLPDGPRQPVLRPCPVDDAAVFDVGMNLLAPFSNRISGGGFAFRGAFHEVSPNLDGEPFPIHGDAFQRNWEIVAADQTSALLRLPNGQIGPYCYRAEVCYSLSDGDLHAELSMTNTGPELPFGGGFHPWFPREPVTRLTFSAEAVWLEDRQHLPTELISLSRNPEWQFGDGSALPESFINNAFTEWDGQARIEQPDLGIAVSIRAESPLDTAIVYSPDASADFFCFEPVSHAVDAVNQPGYPGLVTLAPNETLSLSMSIGWQKLELR